MLGEINWIPATEENIREIPTKEDPQRSDETITINVLLKCAVMPIREGYYRSYNNTWYMEGFGRLISTPTHFAYINEPK